MLKCECALEKDRSSREIGDARANELDRFKQSVPKQVWDLRTLKLQCCVPCLDSTVLTWNASGECGYATLRRAADDLGAALMPKRAKHPLHAAFRTVHALVINPAAPQTWFKAVTVTKMVNNRPVRHCGLRPISVFKPGIFEQDEQAGCWTALLKYSALGGAPHAGHIQ